MRQAFVNGVDERANRTWCAPLCNSHSELDIEPQPVTDRSDCVQRRIVFASQQISELLT